VAAADGLTGTAAVVADGLTVTAAAVVVGGSTAGAMAAAVHGSIGGERLYRKYHRDPYCEVYKDVFARAETPTRKILAGACLPTLTKL
jgi:hypothetical protein